eukprot:m.77575 g.77575  ORF g.77575 m.77575 type:complete len:300 (-) comp7919_c0_seq1:18-917(-)
MPDVECVVEDVGLLEAVQLLAGQLALRLDATLQVQKLRQRALVLIVVKPVSLFLGCQGRRHLFRSVDFGLQARALVREGPCCRLKAGLLLLQLLDALLKCGDRRDGLGLQLLEHSSVSLNIPAGRSRSHVHVVKPAVRALLAQGIVDGRSLAELVEVRMHTRDVLVVVVVAERGCRFGRDGLRHHGLSRRRLAVLLLGTLRCGQRERSRKRDSVADECSDTKMRYMQHYAGVGAHHVCARREPSRECLVSPRQHHSRRCRHYHRRPSAGGAGRPCGPARRPGRRDPCPAGSGTSGTQSW